MPIPDHIWILTMSIKSTLEYPVGRLVLWYIENDLTSLKGESETKFATDDHSKFQKKKEEEDTNKPHDEQVRPTMKFS